MVVRKTARREVRLDPEDDRLLEEELRERDLTFAAWVREQVEAAREARERRRREEAIDRLLAARLDVHWDARDPDPATTLLNELSAERVRSLDPGA